MAGGGLCRLLQVPSQHLETVGPREMVGEKETWRLAQHPGKDKIELTPRLRKEKFGANPIKRNLKLIKNFPD